MGFFFRRGVSEILFSLDPIEDVADLTAAVDLSEVVAEIGGFQLTNSPIPTPNLRHQFTPQIEGEDTVADSTLTLYDDRVDDTHRQALAKGTEGYVNLLPYGRAAGGRYEQWPVRSNGVNDEWSMGNDPARTVASFAVTGVPDQDREIPAA